MVGTESGTRNDCAHGRLNGSIRSVLAAGVIVLVTGCGTDSGTVEPPDQGSFALAASAPAMSVAQNSTGSTIISITRLNGFAGPITLAVSGVPSGVTAVIAPVQVAAGQTSAVLTVTATGSATAGTSTLTIQGTATGVSQHAVSVQLAVVSAPQTGPFSLSLSVNSYLALPPTILSAQPVLTIARNAGFTGAVSLSVTGLPPSLVVGITPATVSGNTASLIILNGGAPNGTYNAVIRGVATGGQGERSITLPIVVAAPSTGSITWRFCSNGVRTPHYFFAVKDGNGPWARIVPDGTSHSFNVTQSTASIAVVHPDSGGFRTTVHQYTAAEIAAAAASECVRYPGVTTRTVTGMVAGLTPGEMSLVGMDWWFGSTSGNGTYSLLNLPTGPLDLVAVRTALGNDVVPNRAIIRRAVNPGASNAPIDFNSTESFALTSTNWNFGNVNGQAFSVSQHFTTATGTVGMFHVIPQVERAAATRTMYAIPASQTVAGDLHQVIATIGTHSHPRVSRQIVTYFRTLAARTLDFGPALPMPTVTVVPGAPEGRLRIQGLLPTEYESGVTLDATQSGTARFATVHTTRGFMGPGASYDVQLPDLSSAIGWDTSFALRTGNPVTWMVSGGGPVLDFFDGRYIFNSTRVRWTGAQSGIAAPTDGQTFRMARVSGTITP